MVATAILSPRVLRIVPVKSPTTGLVCASWVELAFVDGTGAEGAVDLYVAEPPDKVFASLDRAKTCGPLLVIAEPTKDKNPVTGRRWCIGAIGPSREISIPPVTGMVLPFEKMESVIVAPKVLASYEAEAASHFFAGHRATCLDLDVGDTSDRLMHTVITMPPGDVARYLENARIIRKRIVLWFGEDVGVSHVRTGKPVYIGRIERL